MFLQDTTCDCSSSTDQGDYSWIYGVRVGVISLSTIFLCAIIFLIGIRKQWRHKEIRLFLIVIAFYVCSLVSVLPHNPSFNLGCKLLPDKCSMSELMNKIADAGQSYKCALEGFLNISFYSLTYWFAIRITKNIMHQLKKENEELKKRLYRVDFVILGIVIWYLVPFILTFCKDVMFSFGPTGYPWNDDKKYFFYSGIITREDSEGAQALVGFWMLLVPISLCAYAIYLQRQISKLKRQINNYQLTRTEVSLIRKRKISFIIFIVQIINATKLILGFFASNSQPLQIIVFIINTLYDFVPLSLFLIYLRYYGRGGIIFEDPSRIFGGDSTIITEHDPRLLD